MNRTSVVSINPFTPVARTWVLALFVLAVVTKAVFGQGSNRDVELSNVVGSRYLQPHFVGRSYKLSNDIRRIRFRVIDVSKAVWEWRNKPVLRTHGYVARLLLGLKAALLDLSRLEHELLSLDQEVVSAQFASKQPLKECSDGLKEIGIDLNVARSEIDDVRAEALGKRKLKGPFPGSTSPIMPPRLRSER